MNQLMRLNDRVVVWAVEQRIRAEEFEAIRHRWREIVGDEVQLVVFPETRVVVNERDEPLMFEFTGDVTPTFVAEFQRWWSEATKTAP